MSFYFKSSFFSGSLATTKTLKAHAGKQQLSLRPIGAVSSIPSPLAHYSLQIAVSRHMAQLLLTRTGHVASSVDATATALVALEQGPSIASSEEGVDDDLMIDIDSGDEVLGTSDAFLDEGFSLAAAGYEGALSEGGFIASAVPPSPGGPREDRPVSYV